MKNKKLFWLKVIYFLCLVTLLIQAYSTIVLNLPLHWGIFLGNGILGVWVGGEINRLKNISQELPSSNESTLETA